MGTPFWWCEREERPNEPSKSFLIGAGFQHILHRNPHTNEPTIALGMNPYTGELYACKLLRNPASTQPDHLDIGLCPSDYPEFRLLQAMVSPHIIRFHDFCQHTNKPLLVTEYCERGHLQLEPDLLGSGVEQARNTVVQMVFQILLALDHIHSRRIVHYDVHAENILIKGDNPNELVFKLSNFSRAKDTFPYTYPGRKHPSRVPPPEVREQFAAEPSLADRCDVWSLGWTAASLILGERLAPEDSVESIRRKLTAALNAAEGEALVGCIATMLEPDPRQRLNASQCLDEMVKTWGNHFFRMNPLNTGVDQGAPSMWEKEMEAKQRAFPFWQVLTKGHGGKPPRNPPPNASPCQNGPGGENQGGQPRGYRENNLRVNPNGGQQTNNERAADQNGGPQDGYSGPNQQGGGRGGHQGGSRRASQSNGGRERGERRGERRNSGNSSNGGGDGNGNQEGHRGATNSDTAHGRVIIPLKRRGGHPYSSKTRVDPGHPA
jgi:serine/threonine protein kinase